MPFYKRFLEVYWKTPDKNTIPRACSNLKKQDSKDQKSTPKVEKPP